MDQWGNGVDMMSSMEFVWVVCVAVLSSRMGDSHSNAAKYISLNPKAV